MALFNKKKVQKPVPIPNQPTAELREQPTNSEDIVKQLDEDYFYRTKQTIKTWRNALQTAESPTNPNRYDLLNIYRDVILDTSLEGAMQQRSERILSTGWEIVDSENNKLKKYDELFSSKWFYDVLQHNIDSIFYGHSLIQVNGITENKNISSVSLVDRVNVIPEFGEIKKNPQQMSGSFKYRKAKYYKWLFEYASSPTNLGLLMKLTPIVLYKKEAVKAWNRFSELFGMPLRVVKTGKKDPIAKARLFKLLEKMASNATAVLDLEDDIEFISAQGGDANKVFENLIAMLNREIYKAVLGQTMSSEDSASYSQAYLHNKMFNYKAQKDLRDLEFWCNGFLIPKLKEYGLMDGDVKFRFIDIEKLSMNERIAIDAQILQHYVIEPEYIEEKYRIPIVEAREKSTGSPTDIKEPMTQKNDVKNKVK